MRSLSRIENEDVVGAAPTGNHYIWVINNFIAYKGLTDIRGLTVLTLQIMLPRVDELHLQCFHVVIMASQITGNSTICSGACLCYKQRKHQRSTLLVNFEGHQRHAMGSTHKGPVMQKIYPYRNVIMTTRRSINLGYNFSQIRLVFLTLTLTQTMITPSSHV